MKKFFLFIIPMFVLLFGSVSKAEVSDSVDDLKSFYASFGVTGVDSMINNLFNDNTYGINKRYGLMIGKNSNNETIVNLFYCPFRDDYQLIFNNPKGWYLLPEGNFANAYSYTQYNLIYDFENHNISYSDSNKSRAGYVTINSVNAPDLYFSDLDYSINYEYDSNIGYLVGIKERAKILVVEDNAVANSGSSRIFKFGWSSKTSTGLDVKYGMFLDQQQGDDHYGDDSFYGPLQIQAKLFFRAKVFNTFTGKLKRDVSDPSLSWHEFELFDAFDPYSFQFGFADFYLWFDELMDSINASLFEKYTTYGDLYLRLVGSYFDDNLEEVYVCGPWVRISFSVLSGDGAIIDDVYVVGGQTVSEEGVLTIDSSSPYEEGELSHAEVGTGTSVSEAENNVIHVNGQGVVTSLSDLFDQISDIPPLIGKIFSFLPSWCLELFATAFGLCVVVLVWKVASG